MLHNQPEGQRQERQRKDIQRDVQICRDMKKDDSKGGWMDGSTGKWLQR